MTYQPQPGTIPYRVAAHMRCYVLGTKFSSAQLGEALEIDGHSINGAINYAAKAGLFGHEVKQVNGSKIGYWWLMNGASPPPDPEDDDPSLYPKVTHAAVDAPLPKDPPAPRPKRRIRCGDTLAKPAQVAVGADPVFAAYSDGRLGIELDGHGLVLAPASVKEMQALMTKMWGSSIA